MFWTLPMNLRGLQIISLIFLISTVVTAPSESSVSSSLFALSNTQGGARTTEFFGVGHSRSRMAAFCSFGCEGMRVPFQASCAKGRKAMPDWGALGRPLTRAGPSPSQCISSNFTEDTAGASWPLIARCSALEPSGAAHRRCAALFTRSSPAPVLSWLRFRNVTPN